MGSFKLRFLTFSQILSGIILISCSPQLLTSPVLKNQQETVAAPRMTMPNSEYSRAFGMQNLGSTCFANSLHKILWQYLGTDINFLWQANNSTSDHFYNLMHGLNQNEACLLGEDSTTCNNSTNFRNELLLYIRDFNRMNREIYPEHAGHINRYYPSILGDDQVDVLDYFIKLDEFLKLSFLSPNKPFYKTQQSVFENHRNEPTTERVASTDPTQAQRDRPYIILDLGIDHIDVTNVSEAVLHYFKPELMTGANQLRNAATGVTENGHIQRYLTVPNVESIPKKIMIALTREHQNPITRLPEKLLKPIQVSKTIKVKFSLPDLTLAKKQSYHLKSVLVHSGNSDLSGHYFTYILDGEGRWIEHNDSNVFVLTKKSDINTAKKIMKKNGYLLLYEQ